MAFLAVVSVAVLLPCVLCGHKYEVRGLDPSHKSHYHPGKDFTCLDGTDTISFSMGMTGVAVSTATVVCTCSE